MEQSSGNSFQFRMAGTPEVSSTAGEIKRGVPTRHFKINLLDTIIIQIAYQQLPARQRSLPPVFVTMQFRVPCCQCCKYTSAIRLRQANRTGNETPSWCGHPVYPPEV
jgi:hypothetical protein